MQDNLQLVEKLVEKTGVSYTEAKAALEKANWDLLDAILALEAEGKTFSKGTPGYTTDRSTAEEEPKQEKQSAKTKKEGCEDFKKTTKGFFCWLRDVFDKGNSNSIELYKNGERKLGMPVTVFIILIILGFWIILPLMIVSLFFGCSYRFSGADLGKDSVNKAMGKANDIADSIKNEFKNGENEKQ